MSEQAKRGMANTLKLKIAGVITMIAGAIGGIIYAWIHRKEIEEKIEDIKSPIKSKTTGLLTKMKETKIGTTFMTKTKALPNLTSNKISMKKIEPITKIEPLKINPITVKPLSIKTPKVKKIKIPKVKLF